MAGIRRESKGHFWQRIQQEGRLAQAQTTPAAAEELGRLGFPKGASGRHVLVKVVTKEQGVETHRVSRLSTVTWMDREGKEHVSQFVSLQGYHKRQP
jgi:hypothetical protein